MANMRSWIESANEDLDFTIHNVPFGLISTKRDPTTRPATRLGNIVVDLKIVAKSGLLLHDVIDAEALATLTATTLAPLASLPVQQRRHVRNAIQSLFAQKAQPASFPTDALIPCGEAITHLPMPIPDYTDFCISIEHMKNAGRNVSGDARIPPQMPWMPIGYHGRSSSIVISGTPFRRPYGQFKATPDEKQPAFIPSQRLDYEVEMACYVSRTTKLGDRIPIEEAEDAIFGVVIMNDWSARDIQSYEMMPLGPFQGKNFCTTVSPWIVTLDALKPFEAPLPTRLADEPAYLYAASNRALDINLSVEIENGDDRGIVAGNINAQDFYWSMPQLVVHQASSGCPVQTGDLIATGTCSGKTADSLGSLVELCEGGRKPWQLNGKDRTFLQDGDTVTMRAQCSRDGVRVGFGECRGTVLPAS